LEQPLAERFVNNHRWHSHEPLSPAQTLIAWRGDIGKVEPQQVNLMFGPVVNQRVGAQ
jgi:hypothetical protein